MNKSEKLVRILAGTVVLTSALLVYFHSQWWLLLTCFVGVNLIQSVFTGFCPPTLVARKMGWIEEDQSCVFSPSTAKENKP